MIHRISYPVFNTLCIVCLLIPLSSSCQFWTETFLAGCSQGQLATSYVGPNGFWTVTTTGTNDNQANEWYISATEAGMGIGNCGNSCLNSLMDVNRTLHIGSTYGLVDSGATYLQTGPWQCSNQNICVTTNKRVESPVIDCQGWETIQLDFAYMMNGENGVDECELFYFDGNNWSSLGVLNQTVGSCAPQGLWTSFSIALPSSADDNQNIQIGFNWTNNDTLGSNPSIAIDDIKLNGTMIAPPLIDFTADTTMVCQGGCVNFTDLSQNNPTAWNWTFNGGTPNSSTSQNPQNICYNSLGTFDVTLEATNANGSNDSTFSGYISVVKCVPPVADFYTLDSAICQDNCIQFINNSPGSLNYQWVFQGASPSSSTDPNPDSICYPDTGVFPVLLIVSNLYGSDTLYKMYIDVNSYPWVNAGVDQTINIGESAALSATGSGMYYFWSPDTNLSCTFCQSTFANPETSTEYVVRAEDENHCPAWDTIMVIVENNVFLGVPDAFSPNNDGSNDILYVLGGGIKTIDFEIFNRYGQKVYKSRSIQEGWDGTFKGKPENPGVFVYHLLVTFKTGEIRELKGNVTLIR